MNTDIEFNIKFINSRDAMIHTRKEGETFGLSISDFSFLNKPIIEIDNSHIRILGDELILYNNSFEVEKYKFLNMKLFPFS
jgi:hypothetical protein